MAKRAIATMPGGIILRRSIVAPCAELATVIVSVEVTNTIASMVVAATLEVTTTVAFTVVAAFVVLITDAPVGFVFIEPV